MIGRINRIAAALRRMRVLLSDPAPTPYFRTGARFCQSIAVVEAYHGAAS
jgi:hypothetical protein